MAIGSTPPADPNPRIAILEQQVAQLQGEIEQLKRNATVGQEPPLPDPSELGDIIQMTEELFGASPTLLPEFDPEWPDEKWIAFKVPFGGSAKESLDVRAQWHERREALRPGSLGKLRLAIVGK